MLHVWMSHVTHMNDSCHTYEWIMTNIWMRHVSNLNESCHTYEWVMSHIWMSHGTHMNEICCTDGWVTSHSDVTWLIYMCNMSHTMSGVSDMKESCLKYERVMYEYKWVMTHVTWLMHICNMSHIMSGVSYINLCHVINLHLIHMNESCHVMSTHVWDDTHTFLRFMRYKFVSCYNINWHHVVYIWMSHVTSCQMSHVKYKYQT